MTGPSDEELVRAANALEADAFAELYRRHRGFVFRVALRMTGDQHLAADVVQDVFAWWMDRFPGFTLVGRVTTFLYPVTRSVAMSAIRKRSRRPEERLGADMEGAPAAPAMSSEEAGHDLTGALRALSDDAREMILLRFGAEMTGPEIARATGLPEGTVRRRLHDAIARLRERLRGAGGEAAGDAPGDSSDA